MYELRAVWQFAVVDIDTVLRQFALFVRKHRRRRPRRLVVLFMMKVRLVRIEVRRRRRWRACQTRIAATDHAAPGSTSDFFEGEANGFWHEQ